MYEVNISCTSAIIGQSVNECIEPKNKRQIFYHQCGKKHKVYFVWIMPRKLIAICRKKISVKYYANQKCKQNVSKVKELTFCQAHVSHSVNLKHFSGMCFS